MRGVLLIFLMAAATAADAAPKARRDPHKASKKEPKATDPSAKSDKKSDKPNTTGQPDKSDRPDTNAKSDKSDRPDTNAKSDKPADATPAPLDPAVQAILDRIVKGPDAAARKTAIAELDKLAPQNVDGLGVFLARPHTVAIEDRRKVLELINAQVPDKNGRFTQPQRKSATEEKADDNLDWLASLLALDPATPNVGEVIVDDAVIRALAASKDMKAAQIIFDAAFGPETVLYRDECGRYIRKMEPFAIPALMKESQARDFDRKRYATYQLERLDRQEPFKALAATTGDEALMVAILDVFRTTRHREAVHAVWSKVNAESKRVRKAARDAWLAYVTGPPPPPAPKKKLMLPGGKLTKKEKPLWLTYRELADNELRKAINEVFNEDLPLEDPTLDDTDEWRKKKSVKVDVVELTNRLFEHYDQERTKLEATQWADAKAKSDKGDLAGATTLLDRLLAANPERADRAAMAQVYFAWAKQLEGKKQWSDASAAYSKAHGLDTTGPAATEALAAHHYTLGKSLEASGKDGSPDFRRAIALRPDYAPAKQAAREADAPNRPVWLLYAAVIAALGALGLFVTAMVKRRA
ncbi:MAG: lyase domain protein repeat-containing protein [Myxococcales bacterium]|nr:lyase domain protein repeat-containing protein [Myxococcales bacterium]